MNRVYQIPDSGDPSSIRVASLFLLAKVLLNQEEEGLVSDWGRRGIGVGSLLDPETERALRALGEKLPKKRFPTLYRGMRFPSGMLFSSGFEDGHKVEDPPGFSWTPQGILMRTDLNFYKKFMSGLRSWSPKITSALYYAGRSSKRESWDPDALLMVWNNPPQSSVVIDTSTISNSLATDKGEVLADSSSARIKSIEYDPKKGVVILNIE